MYNSNKRSGGKPRFGGKTSRFVKQGDRNDKPSFNKSKDKSDERQVDKAKSRYGDKPKYGEKKPAFKGRGDKKFEREKGKRFDDDKPRFNKRNSGFGDEKPRKFGSAKDKPDYKKNFKGKTDDERKASFDKPYKSKPYKKKSEYSERFGDAVSHDAHKQKHQSKNAKANHTGLTRLNKYLSNAGICSRREADELIKAGAVSVNGKVVTEMGFKVGPDDKINYGGETLKRERKIYLLLNKPKDYITTMDDPQARRTVMELVKDACRERLYPVGRLDRNTTGLLLFTNDGELAAKLTHPKFGIKKVYHVTLNKNIKTDDFKKLIDGIELEDGLIRPDDMSFINDSKKELGIEIHSGRNRIVRRMFEHLGYEVIKLDRTIFAGLTKKDLPRAKWRFLNPKEVSFLKMIG